MIYWNSLSTDDLPSLRIILLGQGNQQDRTRWTGGCVYDLMRPICLIA
jgi:hypothetical protein